MGAAQLTEEVLFFEPSIHGKGHTRTPGPQGVGAGIFSNKWGANLTQSSSSPLMPEGRVWEASGGKGPSIYLGEIRPLSEKICFVIFSEMRQERAGGLCTLEILIRPSEGGWRDEMAQRVRALTALPKVLSLNPSNHMVAHNHP